MANEIQLAVVARDNASHTFKNIRTEATGLQGALGGLNGPMRQLQQNWQPVALAAGAATAAIGGAIFTAKQFVDVAAATDEALNKNRVIFQENAAEIQQWAETASTSFGLSQRAALDASGTFGNMFTQLGISTEEALGMSTAMTELAADFASFHNADITEVIQAQTAAFRGEYDALQRYVPTINAAAVEQQALKMGLAETSKALTAQDKALATNQLIMQGAGEAAGDFDRTADSLTNQSRILQAQLDDLKGEIGQALIPAFTEATTALNGFLDEHSEEIANGIASGIDSIAAALGNVRDMVAAIRASGPIRLVFDISEKSRSTLPGVSNAPSFRDFALGTADDNPLAGANWLDALLHPFQGPGSLPAGQARREWEDFLAGGGWSNSDAEALGGGRPFTPGTSGIDIIEAGQFQKDGMVSGPRPEPTTLTEWRREQARAAAEEAEKFGGSMRRLADELTDAEKRILDVRNETLDQALQIQDEFMHEQIEAYLQGGQTLVDAVKDSQKEMYAEARKTADNLMEVFGIELPDAMEIAMERVRTSAEEAKRATEEAMDAERQRINANLGILGRMNLTGGEEGPGGFFHSGLDNVQTWISHGGAAPSWFTGPTGDVGDFVRTNGTTNNITVNAGVGDPNAIAQEIARVLNHGAQNSGPLLSSGTVQA